MSSLSAARQRIQSLLDENSFVEIGAGVRGRATEFNPEAVGTPSDGVVTGYGVIDDKLVCVYSQDVSVLHGTVGEMHARKITEIYDFAIRMGAPVIGFIDSAGVRLQDGVDALNGFALIYGRQAKASGVIPQITAVFGTCGGGLALAASMSDFTLMEENAHLFVSSPNTLEGNLEEKNNTASAKSRAAAGVADFVGSEEEVIAKVRELIGLLPANNDDEAYAECTDEINRDCPGIASSQSDPELIIREAADDGKFFEIKEAFATDLMVGFARFGGTTTGVIGNREKKLSAGGCTKAAGFVAFCDSFGIPIVTLTNISGYATTIREENFMGEAAARLAMAFASATVPKINVITEKAFGSAYAVMNPKGSGADLTIAFPNARIGLMDANLAVHIIAPAAEGEELEQMKQFYKDMQSSLESAAARGLVDQVVEPAELRRYLVGALEVLYTKREVLPARKHTGK